MTAAALSGRDRDRRHHRPPRSTEAQTSSPRRARGERAPGLARPKRTSPRARYYSLKRYDDEERRAAHDDRDRSRYAPAYSLARRSALRPPPEAVEGLLEEQSRG